MEAARDVPQPHSLCGGGENSFALRAPGSVVLVLVSVEFDALRIFAARFCDGELLVGREESRSLSPVRNVKIGLHSSQK